jgi:hypothetical protein
MPASKPESVLSVENPVSLIRSRIKEKRLFEARFLFRQLGDVIGAPEKAAVERELTALLRQVDALQQQARLLLAQGQKEGAEGLFRQIEEIAIDVPGLAEEKRAVEGAEAILARLAAATPQSDMRRHGQAAALVAGNVATATETEAPVLPPVPSAEENHLIKRPPGQKRTKQPIAIWLTAGLLAILLLLFYIRQGSRHDPSSAPSSPSAAQKIVIRPLIAAPPAVTEQPEIDVETVDPPATKSVPPTLKLGTLQLEEIESR